ncbi:hypothetical protein [Clostridium tarantellae]|uniref:Uncharacterized protein n=1 Tax=Clostridium tarantellae TaxID=39493 RepID=A0A6I1MMP1_9CLOT|nr:hypothetical protein [Clostridium tarantellae]MPQ43728.1 hypothetical protein [Clostridium tarantellae]
MYDLTILNVSNVSIRFSIYYEQGDAMNFTTKSSPYFGNGQYQSLSLPDKLFIFLAIEKKNITGANKDITSTEFLNNKSRTFQLVGSFNNLKLIEIPSYLFIVEKKYISISNKPALPTERLKSPISCNVNYSLLNKEYSCTLRPIPKNGHLDYFVPYNSTNISLEIFMPDSNRKLTLIEKLYLKDYIDLPKCFVVYKHLSGSTILVKEKKCNNTT